MKNFLTSHKLAVVEAAAAAGQTTLTSDVVDMKSFRNCAFLALLGDVSDTSVLTLTLQLGDESDGSDMADTELAATFTAGASDADSKLLAVECQSPAKRYVRAKLTRGTANAVLGGIIAIQSQPHTLPTTQDATVIASDFEVAPDAA